MEPLMRFLAPLQCPLAALLICQQIRKPTTPPKIGRRARIGWEVETERRRRPGKALKAICIDLAERHKPLKWTAIARYYQHWVKVTKPYAADLDFIRQKLLIQ